MKGAKAPFTLKTTNMISTKDLKKQLEENGSLTFVIPKHLSGNNMDLEIKIVKQTNKSVIEPDIFVNGIHQRKLPFESDLHKAWFKDTKSKNDWYRMFNEDFRFLASLNHPEFDPNYNIIGDLLKKDEKFLEFKKRRCLKRERKKLAKKRYIVKSVENTPLFYFKDLVTNEIKVAPISEYTKIKSLDHIKILNKKGKQKYRWYKSSLLPETGIIYEKKPIYWKKFKDDEDRYLIPKNPAVHKKLGTIKVIKGNLKWVPKTSNKKLDFGIPNRYKRIQIIRLIEKPKEVTVPIQIPEYSYEKINEKYYKKKFIKLVSDTVTFTRPERIKYKAIVTSIYPPSITKKRSIAKKNYELLKQQMEKQKQKEDKKTDVKQE